jgi:hypothetical protein
MYRKLAALILITQIGCSSESGVRTPTADAATSDISNPDSSDAAADLDAAPVTLRVATFNASLFRNQSGGLIADLKADDTQAKAVAAVLQRVRPDIVLINEFDWDVNGEAAKKFAENYLNVSQGVEPIEYPYFFAPTSNTGESTGIDLNKDGAITAVPGSQAYGDDSYGFGRFPGQYGFVVFSRYPIANDEIRTFQKLLWRDMPGNLLPTDWYTPEAIQIMRLSSKNHVDVPIDVNGKRLHILASHPTPPSFDGAEDRNGKRNHDEIRFWSDYISSEANSAYIVDDNGQSGSIGADAAFVILGDLNSDPVDGDSIHAGIVDLLSSPLVRDTKPQSLGAPEAAEKDGQANTSHTGDPKIDTANFSDGQVGNLRVDFVLPSANLNILDSGVFWPGTGSADEDLADTSDHHLVWIELEL